MKALLLAVAIGLGVIPFYAQAAEKDGSAALKERCFKEHRYLMGRPKSDLPITAERCWDAHGRLMQTGK